MKWRCTEAAAGLALLFALLVPTGPARAAEETDPAAAQFFRAGLAAYERHEFRAAALAFEEADRRAPRAAVMYNAGRAWQAAGDAPRAADAFAAALAGTDLQADEAGRATKGLALLEPSLGKVEVTGPETGTLFFDEVERHNLPRTVHAVPGAHDVRVRRRDGSDITRHLIVVAGQTEKVLIADVPLAVPLASSGAPLGGVPPLDVPTGAPPRRPLHTWGFVGLGATAVLGVAGGISYLEFTRERSLFDASSDHDASLRGTAEAYRTATYVLWSMAAACGVAGAVLLAWPNPGESRVAVLPGPGAVSILGLF
jgi:hypothetical protein